MYGGIDVGNKSIVVCLVNEQGKVMKEVNGTLSLEPLREAFEGLKDVKCVVEAGPLAETICCMVEGLGQKVEIIESRQAAGIMQTKKRKTDRLDARALAQIARSGFYTKVHRKSEDARAKRSFLVCRSQLVKQQRSMMNAVRGVLRANGIIVPASTSEGAFSREVRILIQQLPGYLQEAVGSLLEGIEKILELNKRLDRVVKRMVKGDSRVELLMTVPGVGPLTALAFSSTIDEVERFPDAEKVAAYIGLVPSLYQSGDTEYRGRITKQGDILLRSLLVDAATVHLNICKTDTALKQWGQRLQQAKGFGKARVAVARKLSVILYRIWHTGAEYCAFPERRKVNVQLAA